MFVSKTTQDFFPSIFYSDFVIHAYSTTFRYTDILPDKYKHSMYAYYYMLYKYARILLKN